MNKQPRLEQDRKKDDRARSCVTWHQRKISKAEARQNQWRQRTDRLASQRRFRNFSNAILCRSSQTDFPVVAAIVIGNKHLGFTLALIQYRPRDRPIHFLLHLTCCKTESDSARHQKRSCVRATATQLVRSYVPFFISYPARMSARVCRGAAGPGPESAQHHATAALSNYQRPPDRFLLRRRTLHCR